MTHAIAIFEWSHNNKDSFFYVIHGTWAGVYHKFEWAFINSKELSYKGGSNNKFDIVDKAGLVNQFYPYYHCYQL